MMWRCAALLRRYPIRAIGEWAPSGHPERVKPAPSQQSLLERVRVHFHGSVIGMTCLECEAVEVLRSDPSEFDDEVRRFLRTHPSACHEDETAAHLRAIPSPR